MDKIMNRIKAAARGVVLCLFAVGLAQGALAGGGAAGITDVTAQQRYPWNGKVDISYKALNVEDLAKKAGFIPTLKVAAVDKATTSWTTNVASAANLSGDTSLADGCTSSYRLGNLPGIAAAFIGFRLFRNLS